MNRDEQFQTLSARCRGNSHACDLLCYLWGWLEQAEKTETAITPGRVLDVIYTRSNTILLLKPGPMPEPGVTVESEAI